MNSVRERGSEPPDKGKTWSGTSLSPTFDEDPMDAEFAGFDEAETSKQNPNLNRKRREEQTKHANDKKKSKSDTDNQQNEIQPTPTSSQAIAIQTPQTQTTQTHVLHTQTQNTANHTQTLPKQQRQGTNNKQEFLIRNNTYNVIFIEPIMIKEGEMLLEPMEVGKFLFEMNLDQFTELKRAGQYRYKLTYKKPQDTEKILNSAKILKEYNYRAFIPKMLTETTGVINQIPTSLTEREIYEKIISTKKVIRVERIKRKKDDQLVNTRSVKITVEGSELPRVVHLYGVPVKPEIYIYPVRICNKCWRIGHKAAACKGKQTCKRCGKVINEEHTGCNDNTPAKCKNCGKNHLPTDIQCPERQRREHINVAMTVNKMTYAEAEEMYPKTQNRFAVLESIDEFPGLERPNRQVTGFRQVERPSKRIDYSKIIEKLSKPAKKPAIVKNTFPQVEQIPEQVSVITNNPHSVSEAERLQNMSKQLHTFFSTVMENSSRPDADPTTDLLVIEIGSMIQKIIEKINTATQPPI